MIENRILKTSPESTDDASKKSENKEAIWVIQQEADKDHTLITENEPVPEEAGCSEIGKDKCKAPDPKYNLDIDNSQQIKMKSIKNNDNLDHQKEKEKYARNTGEKESLSKNKDNPGHQINKNQDHSEDSKLTEKKEDLRKLHLKQYKMRTRLNAQNNLIIRKSKKKLICSKIP